jgi:glycine cleavage system aminomethyltransferase T
MRTVALDEHGNISDIVLIARTGGIAYLISGEPTRREDTLTRLNAAVDDGFDVRIDDRTESTCLVGLAGPRATEVAREHLSDALPARLQTLHAVTFEFHGFRTLAVRTSDTGEDGFEFMLAPAVAQHVFETLASAGVRLAGATALATARIEACIPAYEPDLAAGLSPAEADLDVLLDVPPGRSERILSALIIDGSEPLPPGTPLSRESIPRGELRSCAWSPGLNATIGLGIISSRESAPGQAYDAAGRRAVVAAKPLLRRRAQ